MIFFYVYTLCLQISFLMLKTNRPYYSDLLFHRLWAGFFIAFIRCLMRYIDGFPFYQGKSLSIGASTTIGVPYGIEFQPYNKNT